MAGERFMIRDHDTIRRWLKERDGKPSTVASTHSDDEPGLIRLDFPGYSGEGSLEEISRDEWFQKFDDSDLVLLYQETLADGGASNFNKLVSRETAEKNDSAEELDRVFGIGSATVRKIIAYREDELGGEFHSVHDMTHIDGIGLKTAKLLMENSTLD